MNDSAQDILRFVQGVRRRQQLQWAWTCSSIGLSISGAVACLLGVLRYVSEGTIGWTSIVAALLIGPVMGALFAIIRPCSIRSAAVAIDRFAQLKDRIQTAMSFATAGSEHPVRDLQIADASQHLRTLDRNAVAPVRQPRWFPMAIALSLMSVATLIFSNPKSLAVAELTPSSAVNHSATQTEQGLEELRKIQEEQQDPELEEMLKQMTEQIEELKKLDTNPKEALAKLSEMETTLEQMQQKVSDPRMEAELKQIGDSLSLSEAMAAAGGAMSKGQMEKAAEQLAKLEMPALDRQTEKAITDKLNELKKNEGGASQSRKSLIESIAQLNQGLSQGDRGRFKDGANGLAGECKKQGQRKKLSDLLRKQCKCMSECKSECESECKSSAESNKKGGKNAGRGASGNEAGDKTARLKTNPQMNLKGQDSGKGDVDIETSESPEQEQQAVRQYQQKAKEYEAVSESVLSSESIPLGQRQTIRKYFESIRPNDSTVAEKTPE